MIFLFFLILFTAPLCLSATDDRESPKHRQKEAKIDAKKAEEIARVDRDQLLKAHKITTGYATKETIPNMY